MRLGFRPAGSVVVAVEHEFAAVAEPSHYLWHESLEKRASCRHRRRYTTSDHRLPMRRKNARNERSKQEGRRRKKKMVRSVFVHITLVNLIPMLEILLLLLSSPTFAQ